MSAVKQIQAMARDRAGKGAARAVRRQGQVPAVIYGGGQAAEAIALDFNETKQLIFAGHFLTTVFEIDVERPKTRAIPRDYQLDPVKDLPVHVDFLRLAEGQSIKVVVPVHVVGQDQLAGRQARRHAPDRRAHGGTARPLGRDPGLYRGLGRRPRHRLLGPHPGHRPAAGRQAHLGRRT